MLKKTDRNTYFKLCHNQGLDRCYSYLARMWLRNKQMLAEKFKWPANTPSRFCG